MMEKIFNAIYVLYNGKYITYKEYREMKFSRLKKGKKGKKGGGKK